jgi:hypothetical protein
MSFEAADNLVRSASATTRAMIEHHVKPSQPGMDCILLGYGYASDLMRMLAESVADPELRAGMLNHLRHGFIRAIEDGYYHESGLRLSAS